MHLIRQHTFDITCTSKGVGKEVHAYLGTLLEQHFYPKLEVLLNTYEIKGYSWSIETLELEFSDIALKDWKKELIDQSLSRIENYLRNNKPFITRINQDIKKNSSGRFIKENAKAETLFFHFLETGMVPANTVSGKLETLLINIEITDGFFSLLIEKFKSFPLSLIRWVFGIPNSFKEKLIPFVNPATVSFYKDPKVFFSKEVIKTILPAGSNNSDTMLLWAEFAYWAAIVYQKTGSGSHTIQSFLELSYKHWNISPSQVSELINGVKKSNDKVQNKAIKTAYTTFLEEVQKTAVRDIPEHASGFAPGYASESLTSDETKTAYKQKNRTGNELYISNAGLILLHPFLPRLFEQLGLCEKEKWKSKNSKHKAVLLTQYLITGQEDIFENELILNKILCGLPLENVINTKIKITKKDKDKCISLLEAVLEYWKPMSTSTVETLRETFLERNGKLDLMENYELWVEEKGYDILLEQLPWSIGMIKTPWMEEYLTSNWT